MNLILFIIVLRRHLNFEAFFKLFILYLQRFSYVFTYLKGNQWCETVFAV